MECNLGNAIACLPQPWDWLENRRSKDDKIPKEVWKVVETKAEKVRMTEAKWREEKTRRKETRRERAEGKKENNRDKESGRTTGIWDSGEIFSRS